MDEPRPLSGSPEGAGRRVPVAETVLVDQWCISNWRPHRTYPAYLRMSCVQPLETSDRYVWSGGGWDAKVFAFHGMHGTRNGENRNVWVRKVAEEITHLREKSRSCLRLLAVGVPYRRLPDAHQGDHERRLSVTTTCLRNHRLTADPAATTDGGKHRRGVHDLADAGRTFCAPPLGRRARSERRSLS